MSAYMSYNSEAYSSSFVSSITICKSIVVDGFEVSETIFEIHVARCLISWNCISVI